MVFISLSVGITAHVERDYAGIGCPWDSGSCVNVTDTWTGGCTAQFTRGDTDSNGVYEEPVLIELATDWQKRTQERLEYSVTHELGHVWGLGDRNLEPTCTRQNSVMTAGYSDCYSTPPNTDAVTPQPGDLAAALNTYQSGSRRTCGW